MAGIPSGNNVPSGGNVLSGGNVISGNNIPVSSIVQPGSPFLFYDAQNIDGLNNTSLVDGQTIGTWVNLGSAGAPANALQATAGLRPFFRLIATPGKIGNKSAVESDGTRFMASGVITTVPQPVLCAIVYRATNLAGLVAIVDSNGLREMISITAATGALNMYAGAGPIATGQSIPATTWETILANFNGASSNGRLNGAAGGTINVSTNGSGGITLFAAAGGSSIAPGMIEEVLCYADGTTPAAIEAYITAKIGANPQ